MKRNSLRERYEKRKKERQDILGSSSAVDGSPKHEEKKNTILSKEIGKKTFFFILNLIFNHIYSI